MQEITKRIVQFRDERNWKQFHNPKDLAISLNLEASELLELFQWKSSEQALDGNIEQIKDELADIAYYTLLLSHDLGFSLSEAIISKLQKNAEKYPVEKSYGSNKKYNEL